MKVTALLMAAGALLLLAFSAHGGSDPEMPCPPGNVWEYYKNQKACVVAPPRSQADCPPGSKFMVLSGRPGCWGGPGMKGVQTDAWPPPKNCQQDSDCGGGICDGICYVNPDNP